MQEIQLTIPTKWNDLSEKQLKNIASQLEAYQSIIKDNADAVLETSTKLYLQLSKEILRGNKWQSILKALKEIHPKEFKPHIEFIYSKNDRTKFIDKVKINNIIFYGPTIRMRNSTIAEFAFVDVAFYKWKQTQQQLWLDVLCASLYREQANEATDIDIRKPFIKQAVDNRADIFEHLDRPTKLAIAYTYEGCRNSIANTFPLVFPKPIEIEGQSQKQQKYVPFGEIILEKIKGDPAKLSITNNVLLYDFLSIYNKDIKDIRKK